MTEFNFRYSSCESQGIDSHGVLNFIQKIHEKNIKLHTFTLVRNEKIVSEINAYPFSNDYRHIVNSVTKTFTSVAVGIAYDRKLIHLDDKVHTYFNNPNYKKNGLENLTIRHLLTMTLGQEGPDMWQVMNEEDDWCERTFDKHVTREPGSRYYYDSMASHLLSAIVTKVTGKTENELLKECFFDPCGIKEYYWIEDPAGYSIGGFGLFISGKELVKLGQLYLNNGVLNGHRVLSEEWCKLATAKQMETAPAYPSHKTESVQGYGFQMWHCTHNAYRASGLFGQMCVVIPDKNVVFSVNASTTGSQPLLDTFFETIYPCIKDEVLEENPENIEKIKNAISILDTHPLNGNGISAYKEIINGKKLLCKDTDKVLTFEFIDDLCTFTIQEGNKEYKCKLKENGFIEEVSDFDQYIIRLGCCQRYSKPRSEENKPITIGSYTWLSASDLRIMVLFKDHTSYNYFDIHFDDKYARVDEKFTYVIENHDYHNQYILEMV